MPICVFGENMRSVVAASDRFKYSLRATEYKELELFFLEGGELLAHATPNISLPRSPSPTKLPGQVGTKLST